MISIKYDFITSFYEDSNDEKPVVLKRTYLSKEAAQKEMLSITIEELTKGKNGIIKEDLTITWCGAEKKHYTERIIVPNIHK